MRWAYRLGRIVGTVSNVDVRVKVAVVGLILAGFVALVPPTSSRSGTYRRVDVDALMMIWGAIAVVCLLAMYGTGIFSRSKKKKLDELDRVFLPEDDGDTD